MELIFFFIGNLCKFEKMSKSCFSAGNKQKKKKHQEQLKKPSLEKTRIQETQTILK